jgi:hypothetical protein
MLHRFQYSDGRFSNFFCEEISSHDIREFKSVADKRILKEIFKSDENYYYGSSYPRSSLEFESIGDLPLLKLIGKYNKLFCKGRSGNIYPIEFIDSSVDEPLTLNLRIEKSGSRYRVSANLHKNRKKIVIDKNIITFDPLTLVGNRFFHSDIGTLENWLHVFQKQPTLSLKSYEVPTFLASLYAKEKVPELSLPREFKYKTIKGFSKTRMIIDRPMPTMQLF